MSQQAWRAIAGLTGVAAVSSVLDLPPVNSWEVSLLALIVRMRREAWRRPALAITEVAGPPAVCASLGLAAACARGRAVPFRVLLPPVINVALGVAARRGLALTLRRARPPQEWWWQTPKGFSYPSRHVFWATVGYGAAADMLREGRVAPPLVTLVRVIPPTLVAATRLLLAVHWPTDVLAATTFALAWRRLGN